jgi:hypothetical protein
VETLGNANPNLCLVWRWKGNLMHLLVRGLAAHRALPVLLSAAAILGATAVPAAAQFTIYTSEAAFQSAIQPLKFINSFDSVPTGAFINASATSVTFFDAPSGYQYNVSTVPTGTNQGLYGAADPTNLSDRAISTFNVGRTLTITFTGTPVTAFGGLFFLTNQPGNAIAGDVLVTFSSASATIPPQTITNGALANYTSGQYLGITLSGGNTLTSLTITPLPDPETEAVNYATINNVTTGAVAAPEPGSLALAAGGLLPLVGAVAGRRRMRRRAA